LHGNLNYQI